MKATDEELTRWAKDPTAWTEPGGILRGDAAAAYGQQILADAGIDVENVRRPRGRPRVDGRVAPKGQRAPRLNVVIGVDIEARLKSVENTTGRTRAEIVRAILDAHLPHAS